MKKTVLAFAVAAAMGVPAVAAADTTLYGRFHVSVDAADSGANKSTQMANRDSRFGIRGSEDLGGGLRGVFQVEIPFDVTGQDDRNVGDKLRDTYVGLGGDFGEVRLGRHLSPYWLMVTSRVNVLGDSVMDTRNIITSVNNGHGQFTNRNSNSINYMSPNFSGLQFGAQYVTDTNDDGPGTAADNNLNANDRNAYALAALYSQGPFSVAAGYERTNVDGDNNETAYAITGRYVIDDLTVNAIYEKAEIGSADRNAWLLSARYNLGQAYLVGMYGQASDNGTADTGAKSFGVGAGYNFTRRTGVYAAYAKTDNESAANYRVRGVEPNEAGSDPSAFSVAVWHNF